ncbi:MAG TPA: molybdopterin dinucleotide binding domain-containing protein [Sphingomonas sp.]|nr:molybdopterin dinucleotide binding domain-containing protein [Sphingomonas sp.]
MSAGLDRRAILRLIAAGAAASVAACSRPDERIYPAADQPGGTRAGTTTRYATALPLAGYARGVTGIVVDDRPIKLEGLAAHPASLGATDPFVEMAILDLYDPQRLQTPMSPAGPSSWAALARALVGRVGPRKGEGLVLLTGRITAPTLLARIAALKAQYPGMRHVRWEPVDDDAALAAARHAFGRPLTARPRLQDADVILSLGADPLGPGPDQIANGRHWATRRRRDPMPRLYVVEPSLTATGALADRRVSATPADCARACHALAAALGGGGSAPDLPKPLAKLVAEAARDLAAARGRALVLAGDGQPAEFHAFAAWANGQLAAPLDWIAPVDPDPLPHGGSLAALAAEMRAGRVDTLVVIDANPLYAAPPALDFGAAMARVPLSVVAATVPNETSAAATWQLPLSHPLESWNDPRAPDGTVSIAQPLIRPIHDSRSAIELVDLIADPAADADGYARVRATWAGLGEPGWQQAVARGIVPGTAAAPVAVGTAPLALPPIADARGLALETRVSPNVYDGRFASNAWAQECPEPLNKEVWGSSARLHPADMTALGVADGDLVRIARGHGAVTLPVRSVRGQAKGVVTLYTGYGRSGTGAVADGVGANAWVLAGDGPVAVAKAGGHAPVLTTQHVFRLDAELDKLFPVLRPGEAPAPPAPQPTLIPPNPPNRDAPPQWAMAIDTDVCIGCNACVVACQAENNVPVIGPEQIAMGRVMQWLRVDRYEVAELDGAGFQPVPCMQCEKAPCEPVCPVEASVHTAEGLNAQVYNRCIGTRFCQANCPYKVRRFNFLDYSGSSVWGDASDASIEAQRNPDVTVRSRGVMEKCTYCVQRIAAAEHDADARHQPVGEVQTACAAACPTDAITFGRLDQDGPIRDARADRRHYALLGELGTRPRTTYLARRVNPGDKA